MLVYSVLDWQHIFLTIVIVSHIMKCQQISIMIVILLLSLSPIISNAPAVNNINRCDVFACISSHCVLQNVQLAFELYHNY